MSRVLRSLSHRLLRRRDPEDEVDGIFFSPNGNSIFSRFRLLAERAFAACAKRAYTGAMRTARKIRYRLEWLALKSAAKFPRLLSRKACYRLALLLGSLGAEHGNHGNEHRDPIENVFCAETHKT
jgi:hypothetical protein